MSHSNTITKSTTEARKQESEQKPGPACQLISDCNVEEQYVEMENSGGSDRRIATRISCN